MDLCKDTHDKRRDEQVEAKEKEDWRGKKENGIIFFIASRYAQKIH